MKRYIDINRTFVVHADSAIFQLKNVQRGSGGIVGEKTMLKPSCIKYTNPSTVKSNPFKKKDAGELLSQVHVYTNQKLPKGEYVSLHDSLIFRLDCYSLDTAGTRQYRVLSIVGLTIIPTAAIITIGVMASSVGKNMTIDLPDH